MTGLYKIKSYTIDRTTGEVLDAHYELIDEACKNPPPGKRRIPFYTRVFIHPNGCIEKKLFVDNTEMDYSIDISAFQEACRMGLAYKKAVARDIELHFTDCVSDIVGAKLTLEDIKKAIKNGYIEVDDK